MENQPWQHRIVGYGTSRAGDLLASERNWRVHPKSQQDVLTGVLGDVGIVQNIIVNRRTSEEWGASQNVETVVDGHLRVSLAISQSEDTEVPITFVDLSPSEEALVLATYDPIGSLAVADNDQLKALIAECETDNAAVKALLDKLAQVEIDPAKEWQGMPEFEQEDAGAFRSIHVHFRNQEAVDVFAELLGKTIQDKARSLWYPDES